MTAQENRILGIPNRILVLALLIAGVVLSIFLFPPILPVISLKPEAITEAITLPLLGELKLTNTLVGAAIADVILILMAFFFSRAVKRSQEKGFAPIAGFSGGLEALLEQLWQLAEKTAGKWAKSFFPWFATIVLVVLVNNWIELLPIVDTFGWLEEAHGEVGYAPVKIVEGVYYIDAKQEIELQSETFSDPHEAAGDLEAGQPAESRGICTACHIIPFIRVASTDLNFTLSIALVSLFVVHYYGLKARGFGYLTKYWNTKTLFTKPIFGVIDFAVGLLEILSEFLIRTVAFTFRLFGNIFAGSVMLFVIGSLVPVFAMSMFLMLEFFIGLIQAIVFGLLTLIFMHLATLGHGDDDEYAEAH